MPLAFNPIQSVVSSEIINSWKLQVSHYTAKAGDKILVDTSAQSWTFTLPQGKEGIEIDLFGVQDLTLCPLNINLDGAKFYGKIPASIKLVKNEYVKLIYANEELGWVALNESALKIKEVAVNNQLLLDKYPGAFISFSLINRTSTYKGSAIKVNSNGVDLDINFNPSGQLDTTLNNVDVVQLYDLSGHGNHAICPNPGQRPKLIKLNDKYTISFDKNRITRLDINLSSTIVTPSITAFCVASVNNNSLPYARLISLQSAKASADSGNLESAPLISGIEDNNTVAARREKYQAPTPIIFDKFYIFNACINNKLVKIRKNQEAFVSSDYLNPPPLSIDKITLGYSTQGLNTNSEYHGLTGNISEILLYPSEQVENIIDELNTYYQFF